ncbi:6-phosphogluconolactonase [Epilithonimonas ginsengisoli]|uniref:6-phosphogluconolactonase n=1 Tax=Epilithonimonas ginsengisoli TaxID=1245592 RepID=A0ABU4JHT5_9FLAO|nr:MULTISPECIES: 6-phosphogluconolactonase [Chryseobacterium group]MBV6880527.1 6-phosphogluconolactonase [Epilithonimonas sp. FP105]MDW8549138.1 6-phosphogluconolactonase [Epilithonimonas ginsengisoli]OAH72876.1 6-phosphogluconolactonase [Chryseobacterium sp. FP211-J200]
MGVTIVDNLDQLYKEAADQFVDLAKEAIQERGKFVVALSGGSSPKAIFKLLATRDYAEKIDWKNIYFFWVDERWVPLDDDKSNAKMTFETLLNEVPVNKNQIFPMFKEGISPEDYAVEYENEIRNILGEEGRFDFILLGMGDDGHTASLFPGEQVLNENKKWVDAYYLAPQEMYRITLTAPIINKAEHVLVITFGASKKHALNEVLNGEYNPKLYPLQLIKPEKRELQFLTDSETVTSI